MQNFSSFLYNFFLIEHYDMFGNFSGITFNFSHTLYILYFCIFILFLIIYFLIQNILLNKRLKTFLSGNNAKSLEKIIEKNIKDIEVLKEEKRIIETHILHHTKKLETVLRNNFTVRFKAGENAESNQSFATGFLNDLGDGILLSTLSIRNHTSIFAKPVKNYKSDLELNEEEKEVLEKIKDEHKKLR